MANHFSALKRARQTTKRTAINQSNTSRFRGAMRKFRAALELGDKKAAQAAYGGTCSAIDKAAQKGTIHRNTAARYKSRLSARLAKLK